MNYIERIGVNVPLGLAFFGLAAIALVALVVFILVENRRTKGDWSGRSFVVFCALAIAFVGSVGTSLCLITPTTYAARDKQEAAIREQVKDTYGVTLRDDQFEKLKYPEDRPKGGTQSFGSFEQTSMVGDGKFLKREISLVWVDGKLVLAESADGENFAPLKVKG